MQLPPPITKFEYSGISQTILDNIIQKGFKAPTPI